MIRADVNEHEIKQFQIANSTDQFHHIWREFECEEAPASWLLWPHSKSKEWDHKIIEQEIPR